MVKVYQSHRSRIEDKLLDYTFNAREKVLNERQYSLASDVYNSCYDTQTKTKMFALPTGWLPTTNNIYVNAGGYSIHLDFGSYNNRVTKPIPYCHAYSTQRNLTDQDLIDKVQTYANDAKRFHEEKNAFRYKIRSFLKSITTDKRLFELMPELKEVIGDNFFGIPQPVSTAIVTTAAEIMCVVAKNRGEDREGCCEGKLVKEIV